MMTGKSYRLALVAMAGAAGLAVLLATLASAQTTPAKPANCNAWKIDEKKGRILFNDPQITFTMLEKVQRDALRSQGTPGQLFVMKSCDAPDLEAELPVYAEPADTKNPAPEKVFCGVRVVVLEERTNWVRVRGHTKSWEGTGWVRVADNVVLVKY